MLNQKQMDQPAGIQPSKQEKLYNICTMLAQRRSVAQMLYKCFVFAGK